MIPTWKIKREFIRFGQQLRTIPEAITEPIINHGHERAFQKGFPVIDGNAQVTGKPAIFLIFQPNGIQQSTIRTCSALIEKGYCPLIVSNTQISDADLSRLQDCAWKIVVRPNVGHDFGGYRDGLRLLFDWETEVEHLLILNDSVWVNPTPQSDLISLLENNLTEICGLVMRHRGNERFLESYVYAISKNVFNSTEFRNWWLSFRQTSNKYKVIRRGERGFSKDMIAAGFKVDGIFDNAAFLEDMSKASDPFLLSTLNYAAHVDAEFSENARRLVALSQGANWRPQVQEHLKQSLMKEVFYSAYPFAANGLYNYPVLKRSGDRVAVIWRKTLLRAMNDKKISDLDDVIMSELNKAVRKDENQL